MTTPITNPAILLVLDRQHFLEPVVVPLQSLAHATLGKTARKPSPLASCADHEKTLELQVISNVCECDFGVVSGRRQQVVSIHRPPTVGFATLAAH